MCVCVRVHAQDSVVCMCKMIPGVNGCFLMCPAVSDVAISLGSVDYRRASFDEHISRYLLHLPSRTELGHVQGSVVQTALFLNPHVDCVIVSCCWEAFSPFTAYLLVV